MGAVMCHKLSPEMSPPWLKLWCQDRLTSVATQHSAMQRRRTPRKPPHAAPNGKLGRCETFRFFNIWGLFAYV
eukprot:1453887-Amphidinium_carterae.1